MSVVTIDPAATAAALPLAATAAASVLAARLGLPAPAGGVTSEPTMALGPEGTVAMGPGAKAYSAGLRTTTSPGGGPGVDGHVVVALAAELVAAVESGPLGPADLAAALAPAVAEALSALDPQWGTVELETAAVLEADLALQSVAGDAREHPEHVLAAVPVAEDDRPVLVLALLLDAGANPGALSPAPPPPAGPSPNGTATGRPAGPVHLPPLERPEGVGAPVRPLSALAEVEMAVSVELGRTRMAVRHLLGLHPGAVVQLDRPVSSPVDLYVNGTLLARGEIVVVDEDFAVRITELVDRTPEH